MKYIQIISTLSAVLMWSTACISKSVSTSSSGSSHSIWQEAEWVSSGDYPKYDEGGLKIRAHIAHASFVYATNDGIDSIASEIMSVELIARASEEYLQAIQRTGTVDEMGGHRQVYSDYVRQTNNTLIFRDLTYWERRQGSKSGGLESHRYNVWGIYRTTLDEYRRIKLAAWDNLVRDLESKGLGTPIITQKIRSELEVDSSQDF